MTDDDPPIPAATLILMREAADGAPEILMVERAAGLAFAAGALVFPGGRIDPDDRTLGESFASGNAAAAIAAIRETLEETGVAVGFDRPPGTSKAAELRAGLAAGAPFHQLLAGRFALDLDTLTPFARWCPSFREARRFDTLFFLARAPVQAATPSADRGESVAAFWATAGNVLARIEAGEAQAIFPTRRNLERLARFSSFAEAEADTRAYPVARITPWVENRGGLPWVVIPEDAGYPVTAELLETARRS